MKRPESKRRDIKAACNCKGWRGAKIARGACKRCPVPLVEAGMPVGIFNALRLLLDEGSDLVGAGMPGMSRTTINTMVSEGWALKDRSRQGAELTAAGREVAMGCEKLALKATMAYHATGDE